MDQIQSDRMAELIHDLGSPDNNTRLRAQRELVDTGSQAVESLIEATKHEDPQLRWSAACCLGHIGDMLGYPVVLGLLDDTDYWVRADAVDAVAQLGGTNAIPALAGVVLQADEHEHGAVHAAWALRLMKQAAVSALIEIVRTGVPAAKALAMDALGEIGDTRAIQPIDRFLGDAEVGLEAASALARLGEARGVDDLIGHLQSRRDEDEADEDTVQYWSSLAKLGSTAVAPLLEVAASGSTYARREALHLLGEIGDRAAIDRLIALEVHPALALDVLAARGECGDVEALQPLVDAVRSGETVSTYHRVNEALGRLGEVAVAPLAQVLKNGCKAVREEAADALGETGCESAIEPLAELLGDEDPDLRTAAIGALGWIGEDKCSTLGEKCLSLIEPLANDEHPMVRNEVACYVDAIKDEMRKQQRASGG